MRAGESFDFLIVLVERRRAGGELLGLCGIAVKPGQVAALSLLHIGAQGVTIVEVATGGVLYPKLLPVGGAKALCVANRPNVRAAPYNAHLLVIPAEGIDLRPKAPIKVCVIHQQSLDSRI